MIVCLAVLLAPQPATVTLIGRGDSIANAKLTVTRTVLADGGFVVSTNLVMTPLVGQASVVREERTYDGLATPLRGLYDVTGSEHRRSVVQFSQESAELTVDGGTPQQYNPKELGVDVVRDALWFWRVVPRPGESTTYERFSFTLPGWKSETVKFVQVETIKVGGVNVKVHRVETGTAIAHLDDRGLPVRLVVGTIMFERQ